MPVAIGACLHNYVCVSLCVCAYTRMCVCMCVFLSRVILLPVQHQTLGGFHISEVRNVLAIFSLVCPFYGSCLHLSVLK